VSACVNGWGRIVGECKCIHVQVHCTVEHLYLHVGPPRKGTTPIRTLSDVQATQNREVYTHVPLKQLNFKDTYMYRHVHVYTVTTLILCDPNSVLS
jgi:hypothetical protein